MQRCSEFAYAMCPDRAHCGSREDACFADGSECDTFNQSLKVNSFSELQSRYPVIKALEDARVVAFDMPDSVFLYATERCDDYFFYGISKGEACQLASFFAEAARLIEADAELEADNDGC